MNKLEDYMDLDIMITHIDEAITNNKKKKHYTDEELEEMQEFADEEIIAIE